MLQRECSKENAKRYTHTLTPDQKKYTSKKKGKENMHELFTAITQCAVSPYLGKKERKSVLYTYTTVLFFLQCCTLLGKGSVG